MIELRLIDNQPFIVARIGKHESVMTHDEAEADANRRIAEAAQNIDTLRFAEQSAQHRLELAAVDGEDLAQHRAELDAIRDEIRDQESDHQEAIDNLANANQLYDTYIAAAIRQADHESIESLLRPFTDSIRRLTA